MFGYSQSNTHNPPPIFPHSEPEVRQHLTKVYGCLSATTACAAVGATVHVSGLYEAGLLSAIGSLVLVLSVIGVTATDKNFYMRLGLLLGFGTLSGHSMGPLLAHIMHVNPQIIVTAAIATTLMFVSFSISAMLAQRGTFLFLGALLGSVLSTISLFSLANLFIQSTIVYQAHLYIGLVVMSAFVLFDTQSIMEKRRNGNTDCVRHALDLFFDLISVFRRLLIILTQKVGGVTLCGYCAFGMCWAHDVLMRVLCLFSGAIRNGRRRCTNSLRRIGP